LRCSYSDELVWYGYTFATVHPSLPQARGKVAGKARGEAP
jgi:hypothetical protein